jgi:hypothetical protein
VELIGGRQTIKHTQRMCKIISGEHKHSTERHLRLGELEARAPHKVVKDSEAARNFWWTAGRWLQAGDSGANPRFKRHPLAVQVFGGD